MDRIEVKIGLAMPRHLTAVKKKIKEILEELKEYEFEYCTVSGKEGNLYDLELVICDISCRDPNVIFELGIRRGIHFCVNKSLIILKDDKTQELSDIKDKKYISYPSDLANIQEFEKKLLGKVKEKLKEYRSTIKGTLKVSEKIAWEKNQSYPANRNKRILRPKDIMSRLDRDAENCDNIRYKNEKKVGLAMPMSAIKNCSEQYWEDVKKKIEETLKSSKKYEIESYIVSEKEGEESIYDSVATSLCDLELVICDISCINPNVMLELGMRLGMHDCNPPKPVIILKDDENETEIPSDISYLRDDEIENASNISYTKGDETENKSNIDEIICISYPRDWGNTQEAKEKNIQNFKKELLMCVEYELGKWNSPEGTKENCERMF